MIIWRKLKFWEKIDLCSFLRLRNLIFFGSIFQVQHPFYHSCSKKIFKASMQLFVFLTFDTEMLKCWLHNHFIILQLGYHYFHKRRNIRHNNVLSDMLLEKLIHHARFSLEILQISALEMMSVWAPFSLLRTMTIEDEYAQGGRSGTRRGISFW